MSRLYFELDLEDDPYQSIVLDKVELKRGEIESLTQETSFDDYEEYRDWRYELPKSTKEDLDLPTRYSLAEEFLGRTPFEALERDFVESSEQLQGDIRRKVASELDDDYDTSKVRNQIEELIENYGGQDLIDMDEFTEVIDIRLEHDITKVPVS